VLYMYLLAAALLLGAIGVVLSALVRARGGTPVQSERLVALSSVVLNFPIAATFGIGLAGVLIGAPSKDTVKHGQVAPEYQDRFEIKEGSAVIGKPFYDGVGAERVADMQECLRRCRMLSGCMGFNYSTDKYCALYSSLGGTASVRGSIAGRRQ
jgi:PAN domain-containing protein